MKEEILMDQPFDIDSCKSPGGLVIVVHGPSDIEGQYYFFKSRKVVNRFYNELALVGEWELLDSTIFIRYSKSITEKA